MYYCNIFKGRSLKNRKHFTPQRRLVGVSFTLASLLPNHFEAYFFMADNKKSFLLYCDLLQIVKKLPKETQADLFIHILEYVNDLNPIITNNILLEIAFEPIKLQLKRDLVKYEGIKTKNAYNARKRWDAKDATALSGMRADATALSGMRAYAKNADTDNGNDTDNDNDIDNDIGKESKEEFTHPLKNSNLFRQPKIPTIEEVKRVFMNNGGTDEMAETFFDKNNSVGWFFKGSPITNFTNLIPSFITNWKNNEPHQRNNGKGKLGTSEARVARAKTWSITGT